MQIIGQVASCLAELHSQGWVHRDLKPGNIMFLPRTGSWMLIDFGLAARTGEVARIGFTPNYAAPEVVSAHAAGDATVTADTAADAWALGVIAFELLSRRPAFDVLATPGEVRPMLPEPHSDRAPFPTLTPNAQSGVSVFAANRGPHLYPASSTKLFFQKNFPRNHYQHCRPCSDFDRCLQVERQLIQEAPLPWEGGRLTPEVNGRLGNISAPVLNMLLRDPAQRASCRQLAASLRAVFTGGSTTATAEHAA